jgi:short-subunit dehydrogenase
MSVELQNSTALVTGATGGIGQAIVRALRDRGANVIASGRKREVLDAMADELDRVEPLVADLCDPAQVSALVEGRRIDVLVANAALPASGRLDSFTPEEIDRALDVNLRAPVQIARALVPHMVERGAGHLVFISSLSGKFASAGASVYNATKFGLRGFGFALHEELRGTGVGVTTVFPGFIREAGMFADSGVEMPSFVRTRSPRAVGRAVVRAIEDDVHEIDVADFGSRVWAALGQVAPATVARLNHRFGGQDIAAAIAGSEAHRSKRD